MTPDDVETIAMPRPPSTRGISVLRAYTRRRGLLMRRMPDTADTLPPMYFIFTTSSRAEGCSKDEMKPSDLRIFAISTFVRLVGIDTVSCRAPAALRTRVSMAATGWFGTPTTFGRGLRVDAAFFTTGGAARAGSVRGSPSLGLGVGVVVVSSVIFSPARLRHAGKLAHQGTLAEADPAEAELAHVRARAAADLAAVVSPHLELRRAVRFVDQALLCHIAPLGRLCRGLLERHAEAAQQRASLLIRLRGRADRDLHAAQTVALVVLDLRAHELLLEAEREVAAPVERAVRDTVEVADPRERDGHELLVEVPHALAAH